jgi:uncharacterized protein (TIGR02594 family)
MPYIPSSVAQADDGHAGVVDVYHSPTVFANHVPVALWLEPQPGAVGSLPELNAVTLSIPQQEAITASAANATSEAEAEVGLTGRGEVPHEGPLTLTSSATQSAAGEAGNSTTSTFEISTTSSGIFVNLAKNIDGCLAAAKQGEWKETGANPRILNCYKSVGSNVNTDSVPWCAAFTGTMLKGSGAPAFKTLSSLVYAKYGQQIPLDDKSKWRLNDVVVFSRAGGGHVGFFRGYNPTTGSILIAGGNQSDNLTEVGFKSGGMPVVGVGRGWTIPNEYDRPVTYSGSGGTVKVV